MMVKTDMVSQFNVVVAFEDHDYLIFSISFRVITQALALALALLLEVPFYDTYTDASFDHFPDGLVVYLLTFENFSSCIIQHQRK